MAGETYDGGLSYAAKWAVVVAAIVGLPVFALLLMLDALGDCEPATACHKGFLLMVLAPSGLISGTVGLLVWFIARRSAREG
jgi:hypothetical protein